jgi:ABC-type Zn uptake system ZnuABC Zn-binding protein ZnuA
MTEIIGEVQRIKEDKKAICVLGEWYNSYLPIKEDIEKGDEIKIIYTIKGKFKNIKKISIIEKSTKLEYPLGTKEQYIENNLESTKEISNQTLNTIIMCAKDIKVSYINSRESNQKIPTLKEIVNEIKESISSF